jgi:hypothetical protein
VRVAGPVVLVPVVVAPVTGLKYFTEYDPVPSVISTVAPLRTYPRYCDPILAKSEFVVLVEMRDCCGVISQKRTALLSMNSETYLRYVAFVVFG